MRRRDFIILLGGVAVELPLNARGQPLDQMRRIGVLMGLAEGDPEAQSDIAGLWEGLKKLGRSEGRNLEIDLRWSAGEANRMRVFAAELVNLQPDVIVGHTTGPTAALQQATNTIPIVFVQISDPIGSGFIASLARPGGNLTGFSNYELSMGGKWLEILEEIAPRVTRVGLMFNPQTAPYVPRYYLSSFQAAARQFKVELITMPVHSPAEIEDAINGFARGVGGGLAIMPDSFGLVHRELILRLATKHKLPAIAPYRSYTAGGGLISYGVDIPDLFRRSAAYVDRILKGERPTDLPVQQPTKFEMVINLKTATALGLTVPPLLLAEADEVIE